MKRKRKGQLKYKMSYGQEMFWNTRFDMLYKSLNEKNKKTFLEMPLWKKKRVVGRLIERGKII